jgi:DNA recombination protein RmuC
MEIILVLGILAILGVNIWLAWKLTRPKEEPKEDKALLLLQNQIAELSRTLRGEIDESAKAMREHLGQSAQLIKEITRELTRVSEGQKQVMNITDQLRSLQDILKNPKQRGVLGEYYLETVLKNVLPPGTYELQYEFRDGAKVDAIIKTKQGLIPVDSKFSLENYNRFLEAQTEEERERYNGAFANDLKIRINETAKYIRPEEGTLDFAFMFIPSEAVYYDLLVNKIGASDLIEYAAGRKKVMVVSPTTFLAYLQTVLQGLKALQIEEAAKKIGERVRDLGKHLLNYETYHQKLGHHLLTSVNMYNKSSAEFRKIDKDVLRITGEAAGVEPMIIEAPIEEPAREE